MSRLVLIIDDDVSVGASLARLLRVHGHRALEVTDSLHAVARAEELAPAVILLDLHMPNRSGVEVARALRSHAALAGAPLIAFTATPPRAADAVALFDRILEKPCTSAQILEAIDAAFALVDSRAMKLHEPAGRE